MAGPTPGRRGGLPARYAATRSTGLRSIDVRRAVIGDGLEDELALDLEHVAELVEDPAELGVRQRRGRRHRSRGRQRGRIGARRDGSRCGHRGGPAGATAVRRRPLGRGRRAWRDTAPGPPSLIRSAIGSSGTCATATPTDTVTFETRWSRRSSSRTATRTRSPTSMRDVPARDCAAGRRTPRRRTGPARRPRGRPP